MFRAGKLAALAVGAACLTGAFALLVPNVAAAAPATGGPVSFATTLTPKTFTATYSCDLSAYKSGIAPVTVSTTLIVPATVPTVTPVTITLKTGSATLPSSVLSQLSGVTSVDLTANVKAEQAGVTATVPLSGQNPVSGTLTGLPAATATSDTTPNQQDTLEFTLSGTGEIEAPATSLTFTPHTAASALSPITCTTTAAPRDIPVTVTLAVVGTKGPLYKLVVTAVGATTVDIEELLAHIPTTVTSTGSRTTGKKDTVTLVAGVNGPYLAGATSVKFAADLPVTGAQPGKIALSAAVTDLTSAITRASGKLSLTKAGTDRILVPDKFTFTFNAPVSGETVQFVDTFTLATKSDPVGVTFKVAKAPGQPHSTTSPTATPTNTGNGGQPEGSGTPSGAPATGGGMGPGADIAAAAGGMVIVFSGGGLVALGRRRRRK